MYISEFGKSGFTDSDLRKPVDIAFDSIGNTYVADLHGKKIVKFSNNDRSLRFDLSFDKSSIIASIKY